MAITTITYMPNSSEIKSNEVLYRGRVIKVEKTSERRNWSDTMDYTDFRTTDCTWALVYIGRHGIPPMNYGVRRNVSYFGNERPLEPIERFAWVDCTGLFIDRGCPHRIPEVDTIDMQLVFGGQEMFEDLKTWEQALINEREELNLRAAEAAQKALQEQQKKAKKEAEKLAKEQSKQTEAQKLLSRIPSKGTQVTIDGFTGEIFWTGVSKHRGSYNARAGVKDSKGNVIWVDATKF